MSKLFYDSDLDYLEIFFKRSPNYGEDLNRNITVFKSENKDEIIAVFEPQRLKEHQVAQSIGFEQHAFANQ